MPLPRVSLRAFLSTAKSALSNANHISPPIAQTIVIGNQSADLDSLCSAIVFAYLRTYAPKSKTFYIPLSNLPSADLRLRPELVPALKYAGLTSSDLITLEDFEQPESVDRSWVLVDHNRLQDVLGERYASKIVGCVDHHVEEHAVPDDSGNEPRIITRSGSCCSLVVEYCKQAWDALSLGEERQEEVKEWDKQLARLALAPILIDTTNLTVEDRVTPADEEAVAYLEKHINIGADEGLNREAYFNEITEAKGDIGSLSLNDILRKDYKSWEERPNGQFNLGISSVVKPISWLVQKAGSEKELLVAVDTFTKERKLDMCAIMTTSNEGGVFGRELFLSAQAYGVASAKYFEKEAAEDLKLEIWNEGSTLDSDDKGVWRRCWVQGSLESSRKQVAPLMRKAISANFPS